MLDSLPLTLPPPSSASGSRCKSGSGHPRVLLLLVLWLSAFASIFSVFMCRRPRHVAVTSVVVLQWVPMPVFRSDFDLTEFGAVGNGTFDNTEAFEKAVRAIKKRGGGRLTVGPGRWLTGPFNLTSHMTLFLEKGAVILGVEDEHKWPLMPPLPSYGHGREHKGARYGSLVHGQNLEDVTITGNNGTIDGQGYVWWTRFLKSKLNHTRGPLVQLMWSKGLIISNITLRNSPFWTLHPYDCKNVTVSNVTILAPLAKAPNTDGIDPDSCEDVLIENCYISVGDDGIAIKSGWNEYGMEYGRPSTNILIRNITVQTKASAGISIGSEMSGGVSNVTIENVYVWDSKRGVRIKTAVGRGGYVRDISYRNITIDDTLLGVVIKTNYDQHPGESFDPAAVPKVENLSYTGIYGHDVRIPIWIKGSEEIPIREISFQNVSVQKYKKSGYLSFQCAYVQGRATESIIPHPCKNLDLHDESGRLLVRSVSQNATEMNYYDM